MRRRVFLSGVAATGAVAIAGCSGGGIGTDDNGDSFPGNPGGPVTFSITVASRPRPQAVKDLVDFSTLVFDFQRVLLKREGGDAVGIESGTTVDLTEQATVTASGGKAIVDEVGIPTGTYNEIELYMSAVESELEDGSTVSFPNTDPYVTSLDETQTLGDGDIVGVGFVFRPILQNSGGQWDLSANTVFYTDYI